MFDDERLRAILAGGTGGFFFAPAGEFLSQWVADVTAPYIPASERIPTFRQLEVIIDLLAVHEDAQTDRFTLGPSLGTYANRSGTALEQLHDELAAQGNQWPLVAQGLFEANLTLAGQAFDLLSPQVAAVRQQRH